MPARSTIGISTGVRISTVGMKSNAVPTDDDQRHHRQHQQHLAVDQRPEQPGDLAGRSAMVMSQAETIAAATRNITEADVLMRVQQGRAQMLGSLNSP